MTRATESQNRNRNTSDVGREPESGRRAQAATEIPQPPRTRGDDGYPHESTRMGRSRRRPGSRGWSQKGADANTWGGSSAPQASICGRSYGRPARNAPTQYSSSHPSTATRQGCSSSTRSSLDVPIGGHPSTHILESETEEFPGQVENEHWCREIAWRAVPAAGELLCAKAVELSRFSGVLFHEDRERKPERGRRLIAVRGRGGEGVDTPPGASFHARGALSGARDRRRTIRGAQAASRIQRAC